MPSTEELFRELERLLGAVQHELTETEWLLDKTREDDDHRDKQ